MQSAGEVLMRIALISSVFPPNGQSGIGTATLHHALGLSRLGHDVHVFTWMDPSLPSPKSVQNITVHRLPNPAWLNHLQSQANRALRVGRSMLKKGPRCSFHGSLRDLRGMVTLRWLAATGGLDRFDIVEAPEWGGACAVFGAARVRGVKVTKLHASLYSHYHTYRPYVAYSATDVRIASCVERYGVRRSDVVLSPSRAMAEDARRWLGIRQPIHILANAIDLEYIDAQTGQAVVEPKTRSTVRVTFAGRIDAMKGAHVLDGVIGALRRRPESGSWQFLLAGRCSDVGGYPHLYDEQVGHVDVKMPGPLPLPELLGTLHQSDIFLFPSQAENCPMAVLEAMACGLPIVASAVGGIPDLISHGSDGTLCPPGNPDAFVEALVSLREPAHRKRMGEQARARAEQEFSAESIARRWLELCRARN